MRQKIRRIIIFTSLLLFPVTLNYLSPYVSIDGAFSGLIVGSVIVFFLQFLSGLFFGRAWCAWVCPIAGLSEIAATINNRPVHPRKLAILRYSIFGVWFSILIAGFILAGGIRGVDPLHLTEHVISVDEPFKYITYYLVLFLFFALTIGIGRRGACHSICWMSPFLVAGRVVGERLRLPQLKIVSNPKACIKCGKCTTNCPMSIEVMGSVKSGSIRSLDCILCGMCVDHCPKDVLRFSSTKKP